MRQLPYSLRFLENYLDAPNEGLAAYFPATAAGLRSRHRGEAVFAAEGIGYLGDVDGTMVPIEADNLEPEPENIWHPDKFSALVEAIEAGEEPIVYPGYANLVMEDGVLTGHVQDGNHRAFAAIAAGADFAWIMMSDATRQDLDRREGTGTEALYRAIRKAQKAAGAPLFTRRQLSRVKPSAALTKLIAAERRYDELRAAATAHYIAMLQKYGYADGDYAQPPAQQEANPQTYWRLRLKQLQQTHDAAWITRLWRSAAVVRAHALDEERMALAAWLVTARQAAGLKYRERIDPATGRVVEG